MKDPEKYLVARLRFKHLALVESLGVTRSIRKTAKSIYMSEPAVSKALTEIETSFGFALFERSPAGVTPTQQGLCVIDGARLLLNSLRHLHSVSSKAGDRVVLRLGVAPFLAVTLLPPLLHAVRQQSREAEVVLREGSGPHLLQLLKAGEIDAMLMPMSAEADIAQSVSGTTCLPLYAESLAIIAPKGHPLASLPEVSWHQLSTEHWILPIPPSIVGSCLNDAFVAAGATPPQPWIQSASPNTNLVLVAAGLGISPVPRPVAEAVRGVNVDVLNLSSRPRMPAVSLIHRTAEEESKAVRELKAALNLVLSKP